MAGLVPAIHAFYTILILQVVDARDIGEQSDAVLRTAMPGQDQKKRRLSLRAFGLRRPNMGKFATC
jgi:hypothetical protein